MVFIKNTIYDLSLNPSVHTMESTENNAMSNEEVIEILQETIYEQINQQVVINLITNKAMHKSRTNCEHIVKEL